MPRRFTKVRKLFNMRFKEINDENVAQAFEAAAVSAETWTDKTTCRCDHHYFCPKGKIH